MWSSNLPVDLVTVVESVPVVYGPFNNTSDASRLHPFRTIEAVQPHSNHKMNPEPVKVTKCPPWTAEDEYARSGSSGKTFAYQWGMSSRLRAAIPAFDLNYYDEH